MNKNADDFYYSKYCKMYVTNFILSVQLKENLDEKDHLEKKIDKL